MLSSARSTLITKVSVAVLAGSAIGCFGALAYNQLHSGASREATTVRLARESIVPYSSTDGSGCPSGTPSTIGFLVRLEPGASTDSLAATGMSVAAASGAAPDDEAVVEAETSQGAAVTLESVKANSAVEQVAPILAQSSQAAFKSCAMDLSNSAADQQLKTVATKAFLASGSVTTSQLDAAPMWTVSDDPLDPDTEIITADVSGPALPPLPAQPAGITIRSVIPYMAFANPSTGVVARTAVGAPTR